MKAYLQRRKDHLTGKLKVLPFSCLHIFNELGSVLLLLVSSSYLLIRLAKSKNNG